MDGPCSLSHDNEVSSRASCRDVIFCVSCSRFTPHSFDRPVMALPHEREIRMNNLNGILRRKDRLFLSVLDPFHQGILRRTEHGKKEEERGGKKRRKAEREKEVPWMAHLKGLEFQCTVRSCGRASTSWRATKGGKGAIKNQAKETWDWQARRGFVNRDMISPARQFRCAVTRHLEKLRTCSACGEKSNPHSTRVLRLTIFSFFLCYSIFR